MRERGQGLANYDNALALSLEYMIVGSEQTRRLTVVAEWSLLRFLSDSPDTMLRQKRVLHVGAASRHEKKLGW